MALHAWHAWGTGGARGGGIREETGPRSPACSPTVSHLQGRFWRRECGGGSGRGLVAGVRGGHWSAVVCVCVCVCVCVFTCVVLGRRSTLKPQPSIVLPLENLEPHTPHLCELVSCWRQLWLLAHTRQNKLEEHQQRLREVPRSAHKSAFLLPQYIYLHRHSPAYAYSNYCELRPFCTLRTSLRHSTRLFINNFILAFKAILFT